MNANHVDPDACARLWTARILRMLNDACGFMCSGENGNKSYTTRRAINWLHSAEFQKECALARVDPDAILEAWKSGRVQEVLGARNERIGRKSGAKVAK